MSVREIVDFLIAVKGYECEEKRDADEAIDFVLSDSESGDKILLRLMKETDACSGRVGIDTAKNMTETINAEKIDCGLLAGKSFSRAASEELTRHSIQMVSEEYMPFLEPREVYLRIQDFTDDLCKAKCGRIPKKDLDCKGYSEDGYSCNIRLINDNAICHFNHGWGKLLRNDLMMLLTILHSIKDKKISA